MICPDGAGFTPGPIDSNTKYNENLLEGTESYPEQGRGSCRQGYPAPVQEAIADASSF